jgi:putative spermidine/putrescine transport system ATP-binding protein
MGARHISQLSGGQRQRVAIARALAIEPRLFLLDEPLSALDAKLREEMQIELRLLQQRVKVTTILVTHDQREAMTMSDLVAVMNEGRIEQLGSPLEIYRRPANAFVAEFIGTSNLLEAQVVDDTHLEIRDHGLHAAGIPEGLSPGAAVTLSVRPEDVHLYPGEQAGENHITGEIEFVRDVGQSVEIYVDCAGIRIVGHMTPRERPDLARGDRVTVELPAQACVVLAR